MRITSISIRASQDKKYFGSELIGLATIRFDSDLEVSHIRIIQKHTGELKIKMPSRQDTKQTTQELVYAVSPNLRQSIFDSVNLALHTLRLLEC